MKIYKNLEVYGIIYKITNLINGKVYIGQTIKQGGFAKRYSYDLERWSHNKHLKASIKKYGIQNFKIDNVFDFAFSKTELDIKECLLIELYNSTDRKHGYNKMSGGSAGSPNEETRKKMSRNNPKCMLGRHHSEETKRKMSLSNHKTNLGVHLSEEHKAKLLLANLGRKASEETKRKMRVSHKNKQNGKDNPCAKKVICLTTGKEFDTQKEACNFYNIKHNKISNCCKHKSSYCGKLNNIPLKWCYYKDYLLNKEDSANVCRF